MSKQPQHAGEIKASPDDEIVRVIAAIREADPSGRKFAQTIRDTYDQIYDGQHTGRYAIDQLMKTEKTHIGTIIEINLQRRFGWADGDLYDYTIDGVDIDCKFAQKFGTWMIPPELYENDGLAILVWADDAKSEWSLGVARINRERVTDGKNRDFKRTIKASERDCITWIWENEPLPENTLLHLDPEIRERVLSADGGRRDSGAARTRVLFRLVQNRIINRATVVTVAKQNDPMKRAREVREPTRLGKEGIIVLAHWNEHGDVAAALGLERPTLGGFISARVVPAEESWSGPAALIDGVRYRLATDLDPTAPAPNIPWRKQD